MKPDRWTRMVERAQAIPGSYGRKMLDRDDIVMLLRRQYAALRRVVKRSRLTINLLDDEAAGKMLGHDMALAALEAWRRGE